MNKIFILLALLLCVLLLFGCASEPSSNVIGSLSEERIVFENKQESISPQCVGLLDFYENGTNSS